MLCVDGDSLTDVMCWTFDVGVAFVLDLSKFINLAEFHLVFPSTQTKRTRMCLEKAQ